MTLRMAELLGALSLATDLADGFALEKSLRTTVIAMRIAAAADVPVETRVTTFWTTLLRFVGCTAFAHEEGTRYSAGDDLSLRQSLALAEPGNLGDFLTRAVRIAPAAPLASRAVAVGRLLADPAAVRQHSHAQCEAGMAVASALRMPAEVIAALRVRGERWDGRGPLRIAEGDRLPLEARIADVADVSELFAWSHGRSAMRDELLRRRGRQLAPIIVDAALAAGDELTSGLAVPSAWEVFLDSEPEPYRLAAGEQALAECLAAFSLLADVASVYTLGHSSRVAELAERIVQLLGGSASQSRLAHMAGLAHDLGRVGVPVGIWEKRGPLSAFERERMRTHSAHTETALRLSPALAQVADIAGATHERSGGRGYHRRLHLEQVSLEARALAVADVYVALDSERPHRPRRTRDEIARELRAESSQSGLDPHAVRAALEASGHRAPRRSHGATGLTEREVEVVRLVAIGRTNKEIGALLGMSARTAQKHVMNVYAKVGRESRAGLALFAVEHGLLGD
ncbi:MAG TPA: HD domain-containing phosphohydrolase [Polyangiaceae bacterium]